MKKNQFTMICITIEIYLTLSIDHLEDIEFKEKWILSLILFIVLLNLKNVSLNLKGFIWIKVYTIKVTFRGIKRFEACLDSEKDDIVRDLFAIAVILK
jgi:hypothetical protein